MLVPLTVLDATSADIAITMGWVYGTETPLSAESMAAHEARLKEAAERVVRKWPLLAGVPKLLGPGRWAIDVPDDLEDTSKSRSLVDFSSTTHQQPFHVAAGLPGAIPPLDKASSGVSAVADVALFCPSSYPSSLAALAKRQLPILHLHIAFFSDAIALGVTVAHGAADGTGYGMILRALDAELHGSGEWEVPPLFVENPLDKALEGLIKDEAVAKNPPAPLEGWSTFSFGGMLRMLVSMVVEFFWWKVESHSLFLRQAAVDHVVAKAKKEVEEETGGTDYVSTGDVITAWLLKAAHTDEAASSGSVAASAVYNLRSLLSTYTTPSGFSPSSTLALYPHNAVAPYDFFPSPLPLNTLSSTSLASLALTFRRTFEAQRTLTGLQAFQRAINAGAGSSMPAFLPHREWPSLFSPPPASPSTVTKGPTHRWMCANHMSLGLADLALPGADGANLPLLHYTLQARSPVQIDHGVGIQQVKGAGVTMGGQMRRSRWQSVRKAMEQLEKEVEDEARRAEIRS
ncbi:hypothetical protein JCM6882_008006 [Rhodosporidiobolus microsporus]